MFGWFRSQIQVFGLKDATRLMWRVGCSQIRVSLLNKLLPADHLCACCGWEGRRFHDYIELGYRVKDAACPQCESHNRHRAFFRWLTSEYQIEKKEGFAVVFAPEKA